jgi:hypothetical protein
MHLLDLNQFCDSEDLFKSKALDHALLDLITNNKKNNSPVIETVQAYGTLRSPTDLIMTVLRNVAQFVNRFPGYSVILNLNPHLIKVDVPPHTLHVMRPCRCAYS